MFKKGDRVKYTSGHYYDWNKNPLWGGRHGKTGGEVISVNKDGYFVYRVKWDNGQYNDYDEGDLKLIKKNKTMKTKYYKVKSKLSSHKNQIGRRVGSFMEQGEGHHTLRFNEQEFRSYPVRNLREYSFGFFSTKDIIAMMREAEKMFRPKKEKDIELKRFKDFSDSKMYWQGNDVFKMLDYLAGEIEKLKNK